MDEEIQDHQEALVTAGQRKINLIWEWTQSIVAVTIVASNMIVGAYNGVSGMQSNHPEFLSNSLFLVIGFYFARTNHSAIGGVGNKPVEDYKGR